MKKNAPDWLIRTGKTFVQVFAGTLIPAVVSAMAVAPQTWAEVLPWIGGIFTPQLILGDCLTAAICAAWNSALERRNPGISTAK